jgi:phosphate transport system protein
MSNLQNRTGHTVRQFDTELEELRALVLKMGKLVSQQIRDALDGLLEDKVAIAKMVQRREDWVDAMEVEADDRIVDLLVKRQPVGPDLRAILSLGKSVRDLERMGDEAERIARAALDSHERSNVIGTTFVLKSLERIGDHATNIAEHVIYLIRGKDVRHLGSSEEIERALNATDS